MPRSVNRSRIVADRILLGATGAFAVFQSSPSIAAEDPFDRDIVPPSATTPEDRNRHLAEVEIDGTTKIRLVELRATTKGLSIKFEDAQYLGLPLGRKVDAYVPLAEISGIQFSFDARRVRLEIRSAKSLSKTNQIDFVQRTQGASESRPLLALVADYDGVVNVDGNGLSAAALTRFSLSRGNVSLSSSWQLNTRAAKSSAKLVRLDTNVTLIDERRGLRMVAGDLISSGLTNRAVRLAGFQLSTDFAVQPDLVTQPLPEIAGSVAVPSGLDLLVNDIRVKTTPINSGDFSVRNVPVPLGRNKIGVVLKNSLGYEEATTVEFYRSASMLAKGIDQFQFNLGVIRRRFGIKSNDYARATMSLLYRKGISNTLTAGGNIEIAPHYLNSGAEIGIAIGGIAAARFAINQSRNGTEPGRKGTMASLAIESIGRPVTLTLEARKVSRGYDDLASYSGDAPVQSRLSAGLSFDLRQMGQIRLAAVVNGKTRLNNGQAVDSTGGRIVAASYRFSPTDRINIFADLAVAAGSRRSASVLLGASIRLGARSFGQASTTFQSGKPDGQISIHRPDAEIGDIGYRIAAGYGLIDRTSASLSYRGGWGRIEATAERVGSRLSARATARGSLIAAGGSVFASGRVGDAFALVRTGNVSDVTVLRDNRPVGKTGKSGVVLINDLPPYVPVKIAIDPDSAPPQSVILKDQAVARPIARSGVKIDLLVKPFIPGFVRVLSTERQMLAPGTAVVALPSQSKLIVGFDGILEFDQAQNDTEIAYLSPEGFRCFAPLPKTADKVSHAQLGDVLCTQRIRTFELALSPIE